MDRLCRLLACLLVVGCVASPGTSEAPSHLASPSLGGAASPSPAPSALPSPAASPSAAVDDTGPIEAAKVLLGRHRVSVAMMVERAKGEEPSEVLVRGEGLLDLSLGRGRVRYDLTALLAVPGASPDPLDVVEVAWDEDRFWALSIGEEAGGWQVMDRADATTTGGLIGRLPNEGLGLVVLVADADEASVEPLPPDQLGDRPATRSKVSIPVVAAAASGVPADAPDADAIRRLYGVDAVDLEVWVTDGVLRRIRYAFAREKALYGGPDLTTVTYDYDPETTDELVVPPEGAPA
jgi:hypothetical protein